ncbi:serine carboxypeptidase S28 family protein (macronuclear) [Tetrahymena thermophila SB210]|uniref:Serine carboxypeptidase S28 family protein n=1 Tax=Tetrahymena thermophila (strain SB210) TaxID=312017 RepID=W7XIQ4_TETTS|nr:serine carboxypeptidase S28 family protein [Tetrahymena thermophila SB210]EWS74816.1 serine carboxypeptidase S28 family protein [Tetrahymena thermophila SB210]|eukprot:XP_012652647.1 serine carboxypeptidase S28 family protein [Tetrahymena thermophila SB210]
MRGRHLLSAHNLYVFLISLSIALGSFMEEHYFNEQRYDHFSNNFELWDQRYFIAKNEKSQNGQLGKVNIIFVCDKDLTHDILSCIPPFFDSQRRNSDVNIFLLEMRYYGESQPYSSRYLGIDYLSYQSIQQNIADIALFVSFLKKDNMVSSDSKNILVGQNWSGSIGTWTRIKYPHLIDGVIAFNSQLVNINYEQYNQILDQQLSQTNPQCKQQISELLINLTQQIQEQSSKKQLLELFDFKHNIDQNIFIFYFQGLLQQELENKIKILEFCSQIQNKTISQIVNEIVSKSSQEYKNLFDIQEFASLSDSNNATQTKRKNQYLPFIRLQCSDLGFSKFFSNQVTENSQSTIFKKIPQYIFQKICQTLFNQPFHKNVDQLQQLFGGINFNHQNTLFINNMDNLSTIAYKNCTEQQINHKKNKVKFDDDKVRRCLNLNENGQNIADYINKAIYQWTDCISMKNAKKDKTNKKDQNEHKDQKNKKKQRKPKKPTKKKQQ